MSRVDNSGHFFQTTDSIAAGARRAAKAKNKHGDPVNLTSKILAVCADPLDDGAVYLTESAGEVKRIVLESREVTRLHPSVGAPLTSLTVLPDSSDVFTGSWDKAIHPVCRARKTPTTSPLAGHADFVKCLLATTLDGRAIIISGGADAAIIVWDAASGAVLHKLKTSSAVQDLAIDPLSQSERAVASAGESLELFSAHSGPEIRRWHISCARAAELPDSESAPLRPHETSVYRLRFDGDGDLWTASADKTAAHLVRDRGWEADAVLPHPDFVRDVVVGEAAGVVVTACRDEEVRVWDVASGKLLCTYSGHFDEVTGLALVLGGRAVVSVSIDGTVRRWSLEKGDMRRFSEEREKEANGENLAGDDAPQVKESQLTAEEEAELAELMDEDD